MSREFDVFSNPDRNWRGAGRSDARLDFHFMVLGAAFAVIVILFVVGLAIAWAALAP